MNVMNNSMNMDNSTDMDNSPNADKSISNNVTKIVITGALGCGKTSYVALSLYCMYRLSLRKDSTYALWTMDHENETIYLSDYPDLMKRGKWPDKTQIKFEGLFHLEYDNFISRCCMGSWRKRTRSESLVRLVDLSGEVCSRKEQDAKDFSEALQKTQDAEYFMLVVDACRMEDNDEVQKDTMKGLGFILDKHIREKKDIKLAVVFTKCDRLSPDRYPVETRVEDLTNRFQDYCSAASQVFAKATTEYFCVSCLPNPAHLEVSTMAGSVANSDWSWEDMIDQLGPWEWMFKKMSYLRGLTW